MANAVKKMRLPPASNANLQKWVEGQAPSALVPQVTGASGAQAKPSGPGIVERASGSYRRRLVVYVEPDRARQLKAAAAMRGTDMSEIVDGLIADWLEQG